VCSIVTILLLSACAAPQRTEPTVLGVKQVAGAQAQLPSEYVFCDLAGGSWTCGETTPKTLVNQPRRTDRLRVPGAIEPPILSARGSRSTITPNSPSAPITDMPLVKARPDLTDDALLASADIAEGWQNVPSSSTPSTSVETDGFRASIDALLSNPNRSQATDLPDKTPEDNSDIPPTVQDDVRAVIHFDRKSSQPDFTGLSGFVDTLSGKDVYIQAHTDDLGGSEYNMMLSQLRAYETFDYLVSTGVPKERITVRAFGECCAAVPNTTDTNRAQNRRVEIRAIQPSTPDANS